jgi:hypothetical protein
MPKTLKERLKPTAYKAIVDAEPTRPNSVAAAFTALEREYFITDLRLSEVYNIMSLVQSPGSFFDFNDIFDLFQNDEAK